MSDDELANARTFLEWLRTGIAAMGLGFVVANIEGKPSSWPRPR
jgi:uncharacterized membrane protein YidH (DUF202 family)